jgi:hypothetical protein
MKLAFCQKLAIFLLLLLPVSLEAQNGLLMLYGKVVNDMQSIGEVRVEVISAKNDTIWDFVTPRNGSYKVNIPLGEVYTIEFNKEGYFKKSVGVMGFAIKDTIEQVSGRYFYQLDIELLPQDTDEQPIVIPPVAKLYIKDPDKGFTYDKQYVKWVQDEYEELTE